MAVDFYYSIVYVCRISMIWMIFCLVGVVVVGFFGIVYFNEYLVVVGVVN